MSGNRRLAPLHLVFIPDRNHWCLVREGAWYRVANEIDVAYLLSILRAEIIHSKQLQEFPAIMDRVTVEQVNDTSCVISFRDLSKQTLTQEILAIDGDALVDVNWNSGSFADGWTDLIAELEVEASGLLAFEVFLPSSNLFDKKELTATIEGDVAFRCEVPRGAGFKTPSINLDRFETPSTVRLSSAYADRAPGDQRDLGVLVTGILLNGTPVVPGRVTF